MPSCFVIIGYGTKKDYINNRDIDLEKTFKYIIKPVFEEMGYECMRSCDYPPGMIDTIMYKGIYNADFVLADISTLNPNALYELGVRHALKPYTTLVICEDGIFINNKLPFDLSHITALSYHHEGKFLDVEEVDRFKSILNNAIKGMLDNRLTDSPVFTHIPGLEILVKDSTETKVTNIIHPIHGIDTMQVAESDNEGPSLSDMIADAVSLMGSKKFKEAIAAFESLLLLKPNDPFFIQQFCLATYKSELPDPISANKKAYEILEKLSPLSSIDTETLGMAGAIHKNLYKLTNDKVLLEKSLRFYERGYYIGNDYYNGINTAFLYWIMASLADSKEKTQFYKMQAKQIAAHVIELCNNLKNQEDYAKRKDKQWISNTLAEGYFGIDNTLMLDLFLKERKKEQNDFSEETFIRQFDQLKILKQKVEDILKAS